MAERPELAGIATRPALRVRVYVGERDHHKRQPLFMAIVEAARKAGLAGASVFKGIEGYGGHAVVHLARVVDVVGDLPVLVELIDSPERIGAFLPTLNAMVGEGLISLEEIAVLDRARATPTA